MKIHRRASHRDLAWLGVLLGIALAAPAIAHDTVYYYYTDTLHSAVVETDAQGNVIERTYYGPYGLVLDRSMRDGPGYGGHEEDPATSLNYMQQRYYDPQAGRFVSTDPVLPTESGGNFNRYGFANDNPYRYTDPDGRAITIGYEDSHLLGDISQTFGYLIHSRTFSLMLCVLLVSPTTYHIDFATTDHNGGPLHSYYDPITHTAYLNPREAIKIASSGEIEPSALVSAHELAHAYQDEELLNDLEKYNALFPTQTKLGQVREGERRATAIEQKIARELGVQARKSYTDVHKDFVRVCNVTSQKACTML